jgi:hypothetical protein
MFPSESEGGALLCALGGCAGSAAGTAGRFETRSRVTSHTSPGRGWPMRGGSSSPSPSPSRRATTTRFAPSTTSSESRRAARRPRSILRRASRTTSPRSCTKVSPSPSPRDRHVRRAGSSRAWLQTAAHRAALNMRRRKEDAAEARAEISSKYAAEPDDAERAVDRRGVVRTSSQAPLLISAHCEGVRSTSPNIVTVMSYPVQSSVVASWRRLSVGAM